MSDSLQGGRLLKSWLEGNAESDTIVISRWRSVLRCAVESGQFPWARLLQQATDVFSRLAQSPQAEKRPATDRNQPALAPPDRTPPVTDRPHTSTLEDFRSLPQPSDEESPGVLTTVNQVMVELATVPVVAALVFERVMNRPHVPRPQSFFRKIHTPARRRFRDCPLAGATARGASGR